ncbi:MAG: EAL domain-containing protein [Deltaproteobacteria bacterium]|nr:EAL domain-containing protein [Deltaproteobacteria bacterium]
MVLPIYNIQILEPSLIENLSKDFEREAVHVASHMDEFLQFPKKEPFCHSLTPDQQEKIKKVAEKFHLIRAKVISREGVILFSTNPEEIGRVKGEPFLKNQAAREQSCARIVEEVQGTPKGEVLRDVAKTYVAMGHGADFAGAFEFDFDVSPQKRLLDDKIRKPSILLLVLIGAFLVLLIALCIEVQRLLIRQKSAEQKILEMAYYDPLTGLPNRTLFQERLIQAIHHARRNGGRLALLFFDLDHFKNINDSFGHQQGDWLLRETSSRLRKHVRADDTLARIGGDEFAHLLTSVEKEHDASTVAEKILKIISLPVTVNGREISISTSVGIAFFPENGTDAEKLLMHADMAMYAAKAKGRNAYAFYSRQMNQNASRRRQGEADLRAALERDEFFLVYQPQLDLKSGRITAAEALLRWRHPEQGILSPALFVPLAEETGLIGSIGEWVLRSACRQCRVWQQSGVPELRVAVNLSAFQLQQPELMAEVDDILQDTGLRPESLELELTERLIMGNAAANVAILKRLKERGVQLAIDDFGTGFSSLNYLRDFPIDRIKIDHHCVTDIPANYHQSTIVRMTLSLARILNLKVVAEGVETEEQLRFLKEQGCDEIQGYLLGCPVEPELFCQKLMDFREAWRRAG